MSQNPISRAMEATGRSMPATLLLLRISYWHPRAKIERDAKLWIAKTREEWVEETGLSVKQVKDAFSILRRMLLIETCVMKFGQKTVGTVTLTERGSQTLKGPSGWSPEGPTGWDPQGPTYIQGDTTYPYGTSYLQDKPPLLPQPEAEDVMPSVKDMLAGAMPPKAKPAKITADQTWKTLVSEQTQKFQAELTQKQRGQLSLVAKRAHPADVHKVIEAVVKSWPEFTGRVKTEKGQKTGPSEPNIDYLLANVSIAVEHMKDWIKSGAQSVGQTSADVKLGSLPKPVPTTPTQPALQPEPDIEAATDEEVEAILGIKVKKG